MSRALQALQAIARHEAERRSFIELGVVRSVFDDADGPDAQSVTVELKDSGVVLPRLPVATALTGAAALPRVGDVVLIALPRGDLGSALVVGQVYTDQRRPPACDRDEVALVWPGDADDPASKAVEVRVRADGSSREVKVALGGEKDALVRVADGEILLVSGGVRVRLGHSSDSDAEVEVTAGRTRILLAQDGDLAVTAAGKLILKGNEVAIEGDTRVTVNGQTVEIN